MQRSNTRTPEKAAECNAEFLIDGPRNKESVQKMLASCASDYTSVSDGKVFVVSGHRDYDLLCCQHK
jgi:hypothetical protein